MTTIEINEFDLTAYLHGEIDHHTAVEIRETIDEAIIKSTPKKIILDFCGVSFMDSSGIGLIMGRYKLGQNIGANLKVRVKNSHIKRIMKLSGMERLGIFE